MGNKVKRYFHHHSLGIRALGQIYRMDKTLILISVMQAFFSAFLPYIELVCTGLIIDSLLGGNMKNAVLYIAAMAGSTFVCGLTVDLFDRTTSYKSENIHRQMLRMINEKAMEMDYEEMENTALLQKISDATYIMEHIGGYNVFISYYRQFAEYILKIVTSVGLVVELSLCVSGQETLTGIYRLASPAVSFAVIGGMTAVNLLSGQWIAVKFRNFRSQGYHEKMKIERKLMYYADEIYMNSERGKEMRLSDMQKLISQKHGRAIEESLKFYNRYYDDADKNQESIFTVSQGIYTIAAYGIVIIKVCAGAVSIGSLTKYIGAIILLNESINMLLEVNQKIALQSEFVEVFQNFISHRTKSDRCKHAETEKRLEEYNIRFEHVSYKPKGADRYILRDVCCEVNSRTKAAIVGKNGAGKTTFVKLLCGLYEPTEGRITVNGTDIREYNREEYFALFSVVFQDFHLFAFPISENISVGESCEEERVWECLREAQMYDAVRKMPNQLSTSLYKLEEDGVNASGGEAQKIAIARALYKDAPFLILDEPTAALDPQSEYDIFQSLHRMADGKGSIFISHRMGSCKQCQEIIVLDQGQIVQHGSHEELIRQDGIYKELFNMQAQGYLRS